MKNLYKAYKDFIFIFSILVVLGFIIDGPYNVFLGLKKIVFNSDILITDYIALAGTGATFVNAGLATLMCIALLIFVGIKPNGSTIMSLFLMAGFSFFGKNIFNIWPIILGVWLHSKYQKEPFLNYILLSLLGTALSPIVSEFAFIGIFPPLLGIIIGCLFGVFTGFILPPLATHCIKLHQGYNLYNIGLAAGLIGTIMMSIFRSLGINFPKRLLWHTGSNKEFGILFICLFIYLIILGFIKNDKSFKNTLKLTKHSGRLVTDYFIIYGGAAYINMGILGIASTLFVILVGGDLNGPTLGGVFTIVGFGAFGKHLRNVTPIVIGACLSTFLNIWEITSPSIMLSVLFSTTLSPIAGQYGVLIGILAGFLHVCVVMNTGYLHGGLNLYNNGLAGGIVAIVLIPLVNTFRKESPKHEAH
ncbi:DUF1576 domain-containing protein [Clostridium hydrogeniformans]|uniref:DUF1576 domain-containing protein n=1 Tax=Clostridium hydrogeniformans TaxID=349933 RepID=UPI00047FB4E4|nr:DUF1576 domain-containing protein [Clostridium hydrogeniformans]